MIWSHYFRHYLCSDDEFGPDICQISLQIILVQIDVPAIIVDHSMCAMYASYDFVLHDFDSWIICEICLPGLVVDANNYCYIVSNHVDPMSFFHQYIVDHYIGSHDIKHIECLYDCPGHDFGPCEKIIDRILSVHDCLP